MVIFLVFSYQYHDDELIISLNGQSYHHLQISQQKQRCFRRRDTTPSSHFYLPEMVVGIPEDCDLKCVDLLHAAFKCPQ